MTTKATPGPLGYERSGTGDNQSWEIAPLVDGELDWEQQTAMVISCEADAKLYSAAPDLLAELRKCLELLSHLGDSFALVEVDDHEKCEERIEAIEAAIAKATS